MFSSLTPYLLKFKKVAIPHVGKLELVSKPATIDMANRLVYPSTYIAEFKRDDKVDPHQISYIASLSQTEEAMVATELNTFGSRLKQKIQQEGFEWKGIGLLEWTDAGGVSFRSSTMHPAGSQPIPANRVFRENVQHTVLIGEQEVQAQSFVPEQQEEGRTSKKRKTVLIVAGILIVLAAAFIAYYFYTNGLNAASTGERQKVNAAAPQPTYH